MNKSIADGKPVLFNLDVAYELYTKLLRPVEATIKDKTQSRRGAVGRADRAAVPSAGHRETAGVRSMTAKNAGPYRDAAWLFRRQAVTVLPSVASLQALRSTTRADHGTRPFVGFGDPAVPERARPEQLARRRRDARLCRVLDARGGIDRGKLAELAAAARRTPRTRSRTSASRLGASADDIYLGKAASETTVKKAQLADYRVVYFATHGLVAGDVKGIGEPSLALSIPANPTEVDDGLLTSSEVAQLKLNADWVVLSACNTMAGDKPGAEALSGLARAFFYAGAARCWCRTGRSTPKRRRG